MEVHLTVKALNDSFTKEEFFLNQAPIFNFEYDDNQLLKLALDDDFIYPDVNNEGYYKLNHRDIKWISYQY